MSETQKILILEDHDVASRELRELLEEYVVPGQINIAETIAAARKLYGDQGPASASFDLAFLDIALPDGLGISLIRELRALNPAIKIIICTVFDDDENLFRALREGANGYILKGRPREEARLLVKQAIDGNSPLSPSIAEKVLQHFHSCEPAKNVERDKPKLTDKEKEVLKFIAKGYRVREIAEMFNVSKHTVSTHIKAIYKKLRISSRAEATTEAIKAHLI